MLPHSRRESSRPAAAAGISTSTIWLEEPSLPLRDTLIMEQRVSHQRAILRDGMDDYDTAAVGWSRGLPLFLREPGCSPLLVYVYVAFIHVHKNVTILLPRTRACFSQIDYVFSDSRLPLLCWGELFLTLCMRLSITSFALVHCTPPSSVSEVVVRCPLLRRRRHLGKAFPVSLCFSHDATRGMYRFCIEPQRKSKRQRRA